MESEDIKTLINIASKYKYCEWQRAVIAINKEFEHKFGATKIDDTDVKRFSEYVSNHSL